jgi:serine/threonine protein kinase
MPITVRHPFSAENYWSYTIRIIGASSMTEAQNIGKYALIEKIGEGHLGPVYRGFDQDLGRPVVVRILCDGIKWDAALEEAFERECRTVAGLQHVNIAAPLETGKEGPARYIAMESLGSETLEKVIAQQPNLRVETKLSIMIQVAEGLSHAHKNGILHRDLSPGKIHLTPDGNVKIRDFAIARVLMKHLPHPAVRWGAPIYLCPEQIQQKECDERSDLFAAGTIFYELLTRVHPFHDRDSNRALDNILSDAGFPTFERFPELPPGVWIILRTCLARNPEDRYGDMDEFCTACRELLKSLAEDTRLMLSELYASLPSVRKAAARPGASPEILELLNETQQLARCAREAEYEELDRLTTILMEQYPKIQEAATAPPALASICPHLPAEQAAIPILTPEAVLSEESSAQLESPPVMEPFAAMSDEPEPFSSSCPSEAISTANPEPVPVTVPEAANNIHSTPLAEAVSAAQEPEPAHQPFASISQLCRIPMPSFRSTAVLLSMAVIILAGYIILGTETGAPIRRTWGRYIPYAHKLFIVILPPRRAAADSIPSDVAEVPNPNPALSEKRPAGAGMENRKPEDTHSQKAEPVSQRRFQRAGAKQIQEQAGNEADQPKPLSRLMEMDRKGSEAAGAASTPAMAENRRTEATSTLNGSERPNPANPNAAELRRQTDSRKAGAGATLTVYRLGAKASLRLDGRPIGKDGEIEDETIPIGSHTLEVENGGGQIASRIHDYSEGQHVVLVYDLARQNLRSMSDSDRDLLAQRRAREEVERFSLEHDHGFFRGNCQGVLSLDSLDVAYSPSAGSHGFRIPFKILKLKSGGRSISLYHISDNSHFQTFRFQDAQTAERFKQKWDDLKSLLR